MPVFIDPFLLFNSDKDEYLQLHKSIIEYVKFLANVSKEGPINDGLIKHWFYFPEVKQNWLGFSKVGNNGSGLGNSFAKSLNDNLKNILINFGNEEISKGSHLEKLSLIKDGVGRDCISDLITNLIKGFLCEYTQKFSQANIHQNRLKKINVSHAKFNYETRSWMTLTFTLPYIDDDYVILTPKDILTKDQIWINRNDMVGDFSEILTCVPNDELRGRINDYFLRNLPKGPQKKDFDSAKSKTYIKFPEMIDYYIKYKEDRGKEAVALSDKNIHEIESIFISQVSKLIKKLQSDSLFYENTGDTYDEAMNRIKYLKHVIENNDGYKFFYVNGNPIKRESDLNLIYRLTWYASGDDVNTEVNNGRGPVDYKISRGSKDSTVIEFKLASNTKLKQNLLNQVEVYKNANRTKKSIKVILFFSDAELNKILRVIKDLGLKIGKELILIDARNTNKPSASVTRS